MSRTRRLSLMIRTGLRPTVRSLNIGKPAAFVQGAACCVSVRLVWDWLRLYASSAGCLTLPPLPCVSLAPLHVPADRMQMQGAMSWRLWSTLQGLKMGGGEASYVTSLARAEPKGWGRLLSCRGWRPGASQEGQTMQHA